MRVATETPITQDVNPTSFTAVASTTTETNLWVPAIWTPIPANDAVPGANYKVAAGGVFGTKANPVGTFTLRPRWGQSGTASSNTLLGASGAFTFAVSLSALAWYAEFTFAIRTVGATGTGTGNGCGLFRNGTSATATCLNIGGTVATIDTTVAQGLVLTAQWATSNASNTITCQWVEMVAYS